MTEIFALSPRELGRVRILGLVEEGPPIATGGRGAAGGQRAAGAADAAASSPEAEVAPQLLSGQAFTAAVLDPRLRDRGTFLWRLRLVIHGSIPQCPDNGVVVDVEQGFQHPLGAGELLFGELVDQAVHTLSGRGHGVLSGSLSPAILRFHTEGDHLGRFPEPEQAGEHA